MFEDLVESSVFKKKTNKTWSVFVSVILQVMIVGVLILIPLIYTQRLPAAMMTTLITAPPPPPPPPPPASAMQKMQVVKPIVRLMHNGELLAPRAIPKEVKMVKEEVAPPDVNSIGVEGGVPGGVAGGSTGGVIGGILGGMVPTAAPPPPPKQHTGPVKVGGQVQEAMLISKPLPVYPPLARQARITGTVVLHAIISKDGRVEELTVISGHPLLVQAAKDAVQQWRYRPTLLNGEPVEVDTTIQVTFTMGG